MLGCLFLDRWCFLVFTEIFRGLRNCTFDPQIVLLYLRDGGRWLEEETPTRPDEAWRAGFYGTDESILDGRMRAIFR